MAGVAAATVRLLVLGVVRTLGEAHGYAVHRVLTSWRVDTWTAVKPPSIYHAVKQLARQGMLVESGSQEAAKGPARVVYRITAEGDREFLRLLESALASPEIEEFGAGIAFMTCLPRRRVLRLLDQHRALTQSFDGELDAMKAQWPDPSAPPHAQHLLDLWRGSFTATTEWTAAMANRVCGGEFRFADE